LAYHVLVDVSDHDLSHATSLVISQWYYEGRRQRRYRAAGPRVV